VPSRFVFLLRIIEGSVRATGVMGGRHQVAAYLDELWWLLARAPFGHAFSSSLGLRTLCPIFTCGLPANAWEYRRTRP